MLHIFKGNLLSLLKTTFLFIEEKVPVLKPFGKFKITWEILMLTLTFWNLISFSLLLSFSIDFQESVSLSIPLLNSEQGLVIFQTICLVLYCTDIIIKFNTSFYTGGEPISDRKRILKNYVKGGLLFDLIGTLPFWQFLLSDQETDYRNNNYLFLLLFKIYPLQVFFRNINEGLLNIEGKLEAIYYLIKLLLKVLVVCHIFACVWHYQAYYSIDDNSLLKKNWIINLKLESSHWTERYLRALYFTVVTMTTVGYGDISPSNTPEYFVAMACMLFGSGLIGYSINSIGAILKKMNRGELDFRNRMQLLNGYLNKKNIEQSLKIRVRKYLEYIWKIENSENDKKCEEMFKELPHSLREELFTQSRIKILECQSLFRDKFKKSTIKRIATLMTYVQYSKEEWIFQEGDNSENTLYIIAKGNVDLIMNQGINTKKKYIVFKSKKAGDNFGLLSFLLDTPRQCSAKAATICSLYKLSKKEFLDIIKEDEVDFETYSMMRDKIFLYNDLSVLGIKCESCGELNHSIRYCPHLSYQPFKNIIINKHLYSVAQERNSKERSPRNFPKVGKKFNALMNLDEIEKSVKIFQEEKVIGNSFLGELYSNYMETLNLLPSGGKLDSKHMIEEAKPDLRKKEESKEFILPSREELNAIEEDNKLPNNIKVSQHQQQSIDIEEKNSSEAQSKNRHSTILMSPFSQSEIPLKVDSPVEPKKPYLDLAKVGNGRDVFFPNPKINYNEDMNSLQTTEENKKSLVLSRGFKATHNRNASLIKTERTKMILEEIDREDDFERTKSRRTSKMTEIIHKPGNQVALFEKGFDESFNFNIYFPHNNKLDVLHRLPFKKKTILLKQSIYGSR